MLLMKKLTDKNQTPKHGSNAHDTPTQDYEAAIEYILKNKL